MSKLPILLLLAFLLPLAAASPSRASNISPTILIYSPGVPEFGEALAKTVSEDARFDGATVSVCERLDDFRIAAFFPDVKVVVIALPRDTGQELNQTLEWFFRSGGGVLGMGFAGMWTASRNASQDVLPLFGTGYSTGIYDRSQRKFFICFEKAEQDEISQGIEDFCIPQHKFILHIDPSTKKFEEESPNSGAYKVLFREGQTGAPLMVKYSKEGVSVAFATFAGDEIERSPSYYGLFVDRPEFIKLFTNSLYWIWSNEKKFQRSVEAAKGFYNQTALHVQSMRMQALRRERQQRLLQRLRSVLSVVGAVFGCALVYWATFLKSVQGR